MEYKISNRLKIGAIILIVLGILGVGYGFIDSHKVNEDNITEFLANEDHHGAEHATETHGVTHEAAASYADDGHGAEAEGHEMTHEQHV